MNIGSKIILTTATIAIGKVALFTSPSALNAPPKIGGIKIGAVKAKMIIP